MGQTTINQEAVDEKQVVELRKLLEINLKSKDRFNQVDLGDVSKWEKVSPMTMLAAKEFGLELKKEYMPLLKDRQGLFTLTLAQYYKRKAEEAGLKDVGREIDVLLQKPDTTVEHLMLYALKIFKTIPNKREIKKLIKAARKEAKTNFSLYKSAKDVMQRTANFLKNAAPKDIPPWFGRSEKNLEERLNQESNLEEGRARTTETGVIAGGGTFLGLEEGRERTTEVLLEMYTLLKPKAINAMFKASYPVLGNLPFFIQEKLEEKVGKEYYNATQAVFVSYLSNAVVAGAMGGIVGSQYEQEAAIGGVIVGGAIGYVSALLRDWCSEEVKYVEGELGLLSLELLALPFRGIYYGGKAFYQGVSEAYKKAKDNVENRKIARKIGDKINADAEDMPNRKTTGSYHIDYHF